MAAIPPNSAYRAHTNASRSANEPNTSIYCSLLPIGAIAGELHTTSLSRTPCRGLVAAWRSFVFRGAFCLDVLGHKAAVIAGAPFHQGLGFIDKGVGKRIAADVADR